MLHRRILRLYVRRGLLAQSDAASMLTWRGGSGVSLYTSVQIALHDRDGL
ncbi:MAG: hypothetical protein L7S64_04050 [Longimicrobiales bacterium]|nr:hypothetical protein [Longimicrobiales bacterium]